MLTNRPIVIPGASEVRVRPVMDDADDEVFVTFDGQWGHRMEAADLITIQRAEHALRLVRSPSRTYYDVLSQKLKWGER